MNKIAISIAAVCFAALSFFAGYQANNNSVTKYDPVEHCVYTAIEQYPSPEGKTIPECQGLSIKQRDDARKMVSDFIDKAVLLSITKS